MTLPTNRSAQAPSSSLYYEKTSHGLGGCLQSSRLSLTFGASFRSSRLSRIKFFHYLILKILVLMFIAVCILSGWTSEMLM
jgi:hypothetical protein